LEVRRSDGRAVALHQQEDTRFSMNMGRRTMNLVQVVLYIRESSAVKRVEFVSDRMPYIILRGRWFHIIVLNVHAPIEDKIDDAKHSFYEELEHILDKSPKYHIKILLQDFNAEVGREGILNPTI
jgi:hypothetical protein